MSARIPLGLFLKVGGKSESMAKLMDCPELAAPSNVMTKRFAVELGVIVGENLTVTCCQVVWAPDNVAVVEPKIWPAVV